MVCPPGGRYALADRLLTDARSDRVHDWPEIR